MIEIFMIYFLITGIIATICLFVEIESNSVLNHSISYYFQEVVFSVLLGMLFGWVIIPAELIRIIIE